MSHRIGYRFLSPPHCEITRRLAESAEGAFLQNEGPYSILKLGIKRAKFALSSACSSIWNYIFPPAQIGVISRDAFSSLKKIYPISEFIEDSISQPKPLHTDTGTSAPTPGRFEIRDSELKRPFEEITPYQAKRLKKEESLMLSVINSEQSTAVERESFKPIIPENKIKIPPWRKMHIKLTDKQNKNEPEKNNNSIMRKEKEIIVKTVTIIKDAEKENFNKIQSCDFKDEPEKNDNSKFIKEDENIAKTKIVKDTEKEIWNLNKVQSSDFKNQSTSQAPDPDSTLQLKKNWKEETKQRSTEVSFKGETKQKPVEMILGDAKSIHLENIQEEKEKSSEESSMQAGSQNIEEPSSPAVSFGGQSQELNAVSPTKNSNDSNSFFVKNNNKALEKINENEEKEKVEMESVKTEHSTPNFDKDEKSKESDKKTAEHPGKSELLIKNDSVLNPFESKIYEAAKNQPIINLFKMPEQTNKKLEANKADSNIEEDKRQLQKFDISSTTSSNPFLSKLPLSSFSSAANINNEKNYVKPLFVFGGQNNSFSTNPFSQLPLAPANSLNVDINPFQSLKTATSTSGSIQYSQPMSINNTPLITSFSDSLPNSYRTSADAAQLSSSKPFKSNFHQSSSIFDPLIQNTTQPPTVAPIAYQPQFGISQSQSTQARSNQQIQSNFPIPNIDINMSRVASVTQEIKNPFENPFPNTSQRTFNLGAFPDRKFLKAKRPEQK
ncbi:unnamed protein product [Blepharisma stoltei]|uniref:Uncharacterized protein n=1 Tax=Blepharisma stoltei TaxID=1481888 RepID=A0AAU9J225_9CILI|nr:unnamed protein product [Blepharisma stoltei]